MGFFTINKKFLPIKLHYSLFNAGTGTVQPTMPVYAKVLGFSSFVVGVIYTILPILGLIIKPAFGALADRFKKHRTILVAWEVIIIIVYFGIWFIPPAHPATSSVSICTADNKSYLHLDGNDTAYWCGVGNSSFPQLFCDEKFQDECRKIDIPLSFSECTVCEVTENDQDTYSQWQFWLFLVLLIGAWGGTSVVTTMSDTICIEICEGPYLFGKQRLWGSMSWGVLAIINGLIIDAVSVEGQEKNYAPAFYLMLGPLILDVIVSYRLKIEIPQQSENIAKDIWRVMLKPRNFVFFIWCVMLGVSLAALWNYLFWHVEDLAADVGPAMVSNIKTIEGLISVVQCFLGETPAFFFGGWIVSKIGHTHAMSIIFLAVGVRYTLYAILGNPWLCIPIEILQNYYGLFYSTMASYAKENAPPGTEATMQGLYCAAAEGIGVAIGSFIGGYFYDNYGGAYMYQIFAIFFFVSAVLCEGFEALFKYLERTGRMSTNTNVTSSGETNEAYE